MNIPYRINICGMMYKVVFMDEPKALDGGVGLGLCSNVEQIIYLFNKKGYTDSTCNTTRIIDQREDSMINTFFHELYHAIIGVSGMDDYNTEANAHLFANIATNSETYDLHTIFGQFKEIVREIPDEDYRKIAYVVANTKFDYFIEDVPI